MKILVHGAGGHMGQVVCRMAEEGRYGARLMAQVSPEFSTNPINDVYSNLDAFEETVDVVVDFSNPKSTETLLNYCIEKNFPVVIATTGQTEADKNLIKEAAEKIPVFFSANMSVGIAVLSEIARKVAAVFPDADIEIVERHHNRKMDVPSGTALLLANSIHEARTDAEFVIGRHENGRRRHQEIGIHSLRLGNEAGTHEIIITNGNETITLKHEAENRDLFAEGALKAAAFLVGKEPGLYNMKDLLS